MNNILELYIKKTSKKKKNPTISSNFPIKQYILRSLFYKKKKNKNKRDI